MSLPSLFLKEKYEWEKKVVRVSYSTVFQFQSYKMQLLLGCLITV